MTLFCLHAIRLKPVLSCITLLVHYWHLTLLYLGSGKTLLPGGGAALWPPCFFDFGTIKSPKLNLCTFFGTKITWKAILNIFRSLSLVARGRQFSIDIIVEKFKIFKILSFKGVMHLKWKLRTCTIQIELEKIRFEIDKLTVRIAEYVKEKCYWDWIKMSTVGAMLVVSWPLAAA